MNVLIVGLGLIGGAYALRLSKNGYNVFGSDINQETINYAIENKYILDGSIDPSDYIHKCDLIVLGLYPQQIVKFLEEYSNCFKENQIITDVCGVKISFVKEAYTLAKPAIYCSHHPMAGKERVGIYNSHLCVFEGANYLVTPYGEVPAEVINKLVKLGEDLGFERISIMSIDKHDKMIGFTSQLTHAIAVSLVNSDNDEETKKYIGDSYRDLTRIAMINENLWSELFLENKDYLLQHIERFELELDKLKNSLYKDDKEGLVKLFISSTKIRKEMEK